MHERTIEFRSRHERAAEAMSWTEREYSQESYGARRGLPPLPPIASRVLMVIHGVAALLAIVLVADRQGAIVDALRFGGKSFAPFAIVMHPYFTTNFFGALLSVVAIWGFGSLLETRCGSNRLLILYVAGNLVAGAVVFAIGMAVPRLALAPLDYPAGAFIAWSFLAWKTLRSEHADVLGRIVPIARIIAIIAAISAGMIALSWREGAIAFLAAMVAAIGVAWLVDSLTVPTFARPHDDDDDPIPVERVPPRRRRAVPPRPRIAARPMAQAGEGPDVDEILAKISRTGLASLSDDERARLEAARQAKLRETRRTST